MTEAPLHKNSVRFIAVVYLLLFLAGLTASLFMLTHTIALKPILLIRLLQYILLCVVFLVLLINAAKALTLRPKHIKALLVSTQNFKWLFSIASVLCIAAWLGLFNLTQHSKIVITPVQLGILAMLAIFCFWAHKVLTAQTEAEEISRNNPKRDDNEKLADENIGA